MTVVDKLARDWEPFVNMGEGSRDTAIWWLNAIADVVVDTGSCSIVSPLLAATWLRAQAEEVSLG